ncbi:MAG: tetratricopeptide repeat protein [Cyanobacteriota bacterium]
MKNLIKLLVCFYLLVSFIKLPAYADNFQLGKTALNNNDLSAALQYFSLSVQENKNDPYRVYYLGITLKNMGEKARAQRAFETALKLNPSFELKNKISNEMKRLTYSKPTVDLNISSDIKKLQNSSNKPNYLQHALNETKVARWDLSKMPLKLYIAPGNGVKGFNPQFVESANRAMKTWQTATKNKIRFIKTDNYEDAHIRIGWLEAFAGHKVGESPFVVLKDVILRSDVNLSMFMSNGRPFSSDEIYAIALHEFGHALGIKGHSPYPEDVMYYSLNSTNYNAKLTPRDINTINLLYCIDADTTNKLPLDMASSREFFKLQLQAEKAIAVKDYKTALSYYQKAIKLYAKDFATHHNEGVCYINLNDYKNAINSFDTASKLDPEDTYSRYMLAMAHIKYVASTPEGKANAASHYKMALASLDAIANKSDKPPNTDAMISDLRGILSQM